MSAVVWLRTNLFSSKLNAIISLVCLALLVMLVVPILRWALLDATFFGSSRDACTGSGACWVFIGARFDQFMYGQYPPMLRWRPNLAGVICVAVVLAMVYLPNLRRKLALTALTVLPFLVVWLIGGGFGLEGVQTRDWGGLMLTTFLAIYAGILAVPLGILLALGRQSKLPAIRTLSIVIIEFWRGSPIIIVIFLATLLLPLILPDGFSVDRLAAATIGLSLVIAAYMAEAVRGGLQALPSGQTEGATALALGYWQTTGLIILPQALRISLPAMTNEFIALVKNTTLVLIVSIFDLLGITQASLADPAWTGLNLEAYVFSGSLYWLICFALSRWSKWLEARGPKSR